MATPMFAVTFSSFAVRLGNSRICWAAGSIAKPTMVTMAKRRPKAEPNRKLPTKTKEPHGPRLASSKTCKWLKGRGRSWKCFHLSWLRQALTTNIMDALETMARIETMVFGWKKNTHRAKALPFHCARTTSMAIMAAMLTATATISPHHHERNIAPRPLYKSGDSRFCEHLVYPESEFCRISLGPCRYSSYPGPIGEITSRGVSSDFLLGNTEYAVMSFLLQGEVLFHSCRWNLLELGIACDYERQR